MLVSGIFNVRYLTGFTGSSGCVLITPRKRYFFTDFRYRQQAAREVRDHEVRIVGGPALTGAARYAMARRIRLGVLGIEGADVSQRSYRELRSILKGIRLRDVSGTIERMRAVKSGREIRLIEQAAAICDRAFGRLVRKQVTGRTEKEVAWLLEGWMRQDGSEPLPFEIIVASGPRSALPHGVASDRVIGPNELVVIDMGARVRGYCSDMTRTFATGRLSARRLAMHETALAAQAAALKAVVPGAPCAEVDSAARKLIEGEGYGEAFGHALGHGVGLEAHEKPTLAPRSRERLSAGMVVTVEPGIYLPRTGGVRIEDTVVVGPGGPRALTRFARDLRRLK
ncbi:MAG: aminopeptidase P family protein [Gaiellales bacterium]|nr:MAG: aminopeptidase P family protein [Gaiellales bacterium]